MSTESEDTARIRPVTELPGGLTAFADLEAALGGRVPAIFLDYDGTLTPIVSRPEDARLSPRARALVDAAARKVPVAVVSGRDRKDVEALVGIDTLWFAGSHGFDIRGPGGADVGHDVGGDYGPLLDQAEAKLHAGLDPIEGALVERKKFSIAAHYRLVADDDYPRFRTVLDGVLADLPDLKEKTGKKVFELQPRIDWDKGKAVLWLLEALKLDDPGHVPMFFGDDVTDEDAFKALQGRGVSVLVSGPEDDATGRQSAADFRVADPDEALVLLARIAGVEG